MEISQLGPRGNQTGWSPGFVWQRSLVQVSGNLGHALEIHGWFDAIVVGQVRDGQSSSRPYEVNKNIFFVDYNGKSGFDANYGFTLISRQYWGGDSDYQWYLSLSINVLGFSGLHIKRHRDTKTRRQFVTSLLLFSNKARHLQIPLKKVKSIR